MVLVFFCAFMSPASLKSLCALAAGVHSQSQKYDCPSGQAACMPRRDGARVKAAERDCHRENQSSNCPMLTAQEDEDIMIDRPFITISTAMSDRDASLAVREASIARLACRVPLALPFALKISTSAPKHASTSQTEGSSLALKLHQELHSLSPPTARL